jgi:hypothetical protein
MNFKELESCIKLVGKTPNQYLSYLSASGQAIYGLEPLTHYEVLQRGVSKYIENKSKKEKSDIIQYLLGEGYKPKHEKYFSRSWQKSNSPYDVRFIQLPAYRDSKKKHLISPGLGGVLQGIYLKETVTVKVRKHSNCPGHSIAALCEYIELNIESYHSLTRPQRRFLLDYIELYHIRPEHIFIDDHSEEQSIKRQLGLQFF